MLDIPSISIVIAATSVVVGVIFAILQLRNVVKQRKLDLILRLYSIFVSENFQERYIKFLDMEFKSYDDFLNKYGLKTIFMVFPFFEGIGILLYRKIIDIELALELFGQSIPLIWEKGYPILKELSLKYNKPKWGGWYEYLYNETQKKKTIIPN